MEETPGDEAFSASGSAGEFVVARKGATVVVIADAGVPGGKGGFSGVSIAYNTRSEAEVDEILATGLHAFLTQFLDRVNDLGGGISRDFLVTAGD